MYCKIHFNIILSSNLRSSVLCASYFRREFFRHFSSYPMHAMCPPHPYQFDHSDICKRIQIMKVLIIQFLIFLQFPVSLSSLQHPVLRHLKTECFCQQFTQFHTIQNTRYNYRLHSLIFTLRQWLENKKKNFDIQVTVHRDKFL